MNLLWISPRWPYPADDGAKRATASLIEALAENGHQIFIVTFAREKHLALPGNKRIHLLAHYPVSSLSPLSRLVGAVRNILDTIPVSAAPFARYQLSWEKIAVDMPKPDAAIVDGCHGYAAFAAGACPWPLLYRAHNVESSLWEQAAQRSWFGPYLRIQAKRMRALEACLSREAEGIAAISPNDAEAFRASFPKVKIHWVPISFSCKDPVPLPKGPLTFGYIGRMDWPPNRDGLIWFLKQVWPFVRSRRPDSRLLLAGSGVSDWLDSYSNLGFEWLGRIESIASFYARIHASIVPVNYGSGTKIKLVEAASHGRAIFATTAAHRGSGLALNRFALVSDDPHSWIDALAGSDLQALSVIGREAYLEAKSIFGAATSVERFLSLLSPKEPA